MTTYRHRNPPTHYQRGVYVARRAASGSYWRVWMFCDCGNWHVVGVCDTRERAVAEVDRMAEAGR